MSDLGTYLAMLHGMEEPGAVTEVRWFVPTGMEQAWHPCGDHEAIAHEITVRALTTDVYVGVAPRIRHGGTKDDVERAHALWADLDTAEAVSALASFEPRPSMVIRSGSAGRVHCYWSLWPAAGVAEVERANRRLVHALGADPKPTHAAAILRPPGSFNHKSGMPVPVTVESINVEIFTVEEIVADLADPPARVGGAHGHVRDRNHDDPLLTLDAATYVEALTGRRAGRDGKALCPLHRERTPSFHCYPGPADGWACFGCPAPPGRDVLGGDIYTFAAALWGYPVPLRDDFLEVRMRLLEELTQ